MDEKPTADDFEAHVLDAEVASEAILGTAKLRPASLANLVTLAETMSAEIETLQAAGEADSPEARRLGDLRASVLSIVRCLSKH